MNWMMTMKMNDKSKDKFKYNVFTPNKFSTNCWFDVNKLYSNK